MSVLDAHSQILEFFSESRSLMFVILLISAVILVMTSFVAFLLFWREKMKQKESIRRSLYLEALIQDLIVYLDKGEISSYPTIKSQDKKLFRNLLLSLGHAMTGPEKVFFSKLYQYYGYVRQDLAKTNSPFWGKRLRAIKRLDEFEDSSLEAVFKKLAADSHPLVALSALEALSKISKQINPRRLLPVLRTRTENHKYAAIEIVLNVVRCQGLEVLLSLLEEEVLDEYTLSLCIEAIGILRDKRALPTLIMLSEVNLSDPNRLRLLRALRGMGGKNLDYIYSKSLRSQNAKIRAEALKGLVSLGQIAEEDLFFVLSDDSVEVRRVLPHLVEPHHMEVT